MVVLSTGGGQVDARLGATRASLSDDEQKDQRTELRRSDACCEQQSEGGPNLLGSS